MVAAGYGQGGRRATRWREGDASNANSRPQPEWAMKVRAGGTNLLVARVRPTNLRSAQHACW
jgi:hypothetical protein